MEFSIKWETAAVSRRTLTVSLSDAPSGQPAPTSITEWGSLFNHIASHQIPGVSYSMSHSWGSIQLAQGVIRVREVSEQVVERLKAHLDAAVERTNEEYEQLRQRKEREEAERREQARQLAEQDRDLTERFRQP